MTFFLCRRKTIARIYMHDASIRHRPTAGTNFHIELRPGSWTWFINGT